MSQVHDTLHINVEYYDGQEEGDDGYPYYVASCVEISAITDARTWNELLKNIHSMLDAHFEGEDTIAEYNMIPNPRIVITMVLPENYAEIA